VARFAAFAPEPDSGGAAAGVLAFPVLATLSVKRCRVR
jgi:hypothetical protein